VIKEFYLENNLSFKRVKLDFKNGLVLFTGGSGAGKSVLLNAMLSTIAQKTLYSESSELVLEKKSFIQTKKGRVKFLVDGKTTTKKNVSQIGKSFITHLNPREIREFESEFLLQILDNIILKRDENFSDLQKSYREIYLSFLEIKHQITTLENEKNEINIEIENNKSRLKLVKSLNPEIGEDKKLQTLKKRVSKKEKISEYISEVQPLLGSSKDFFEIFDLMGLEKEAEEVRDFFYGLEERLDEIEDNLSDLADVNIESLLDRIEKLSELRSEFGSIENAISVKERDDESRKRVVEIKKSQKNLEKIYKSRLSELETLSDEISKKRTQFLENFSESLNYYLELLSLGNSKTDLIKKSFSENGIDFIVINVGNTDLEKLSYGEQNRVRLAILAVKAKFGSEKSVLFLDEVDANLSGEEATKVAKVLRDLSKKHQVFAISHQAQLSSQADQHFFVWKENGESFVRELHKLEERASEIARMVGGNLENPDIKNFALNLLKRE
jgi:DNA repair protein RecN (Recombination protein N)